MRKVYLAGPMTGLPGFNYEAFDQVARNYESAGHLVINPANHFNRSLVAPYSEYIRAAVYDLLQADFVVVLPGWVQSKGASLEVALALTLRMPVVTTCGRAITAHPVIDFT